MFEKCDIFPLTTHCYKKGHERCIEPIDIEEVNHYCGPHNRCCIDCYYGFLPVCVIFDLVSCFSIQCIK
jgi:hypothetical protein